MVKEFRSERTGPLRIVVRSVEADLLRSPHGQGWRPREEGRAGISRSLCRVGAGGSQSPSRRTVWPRLAARAGSPCRRYASSSTARAAPRRAITRVRAMECAANRANTLGPSETCQARSQPRRHLTLPDVNNLSRQRRVEAEARSDLRQLVENSRRCSLRTTATIGVHPAARTRVAREFPGNAQRARQRDSGCTSGAFGNPNHQRAFRRAGVGTRFSGTGRCSGRSR